VGVVREVFEATLFVVAALFPIVNPIGSALIFLGLTRHYSHEIRSALVRRVTVNSFLLLVVSMLIGTHVLNFCGMDYASAKRAQYRKRHP
jgi:multiple antibiotic resistance protein